MTTPTPMDKHQYDARSLLNSQPVIVTVIDPTSYRVQFQNDTGFKKFGDISNSMCYEKIAGCPAPCAFCKMPEAVQTGRMTSAEVPVPGNQFLHVQWARTMTSDGRIHVIETITDITDRKRTEEALRQAQKMETVGRLAGGIAHDFNNLLTIINGYSQLLLEQFHDHPGRKEIELIRQAADRGEALTKKLLGFSRRQPLELTVLDLNAVIQNMKDILSRLIGEHIQLMTVLDSAAGCVLADAVQLEQVILNLVLNARDAMPKGGIVTIETACVHLDEESVRRYPGCAAGPHVELRVRDTGCGMDAETQAHIFEPFFSTKGAGKGTGLGLTMVYNFVAQAHGAIEVSSAPGLGSLFRIFLPRAEKQEDRSPGIEPPSTSPTHGETVLVAEDETGVRALLAHILRADGYHVLEAADGLEALQMIESAGGSCRMVVTDVLMPRMDGPTLVQRLIPIVADLRVLYISGYAGDALLTNGLGKRCAFLQKPIPPRTLTAKIHELLRL